MGGGWIPPSKIAKNHAKYKRTLKIIKKTHKNRGNNLKNPEKI